MKITIVGTFPPPFHGMAVINQLLIERLMLLDHFIIEKIDTSNKNSNNKFISKINRVVIYISVWRKLFSANLSNSIVYLGLSGGLGQLYDIITAIISRLKGARCILHHHSTAYLDNKRFISQLLFQIAGKNALHVVLCKNMKNNLINKYACKHVITLSNIVLLHSVNSTSNRKKIRAIGYLSNITEEKGARDVIKLAEAIREHGLPIKFKVAGPCQDVQLKKALLDAHEKGIIDWLGPVYDEKKEDFWNSIDIFVFPTRYKNEAEPLVVWEAILAGIPVIAMDRGCISEQIGQAGSFLPSDADFVQFTLEQLADWNDNPENYLHLLNEIRQKQINIQTRADEQWKEFISYLEVENSLGNEIG